MAQGNNLLSAIWSGAPRSHNVEKALDSFQRFIRSQVVGSIVLLVSATMAIIWANSPWAASYFELWTTELSFTLGQSSFSMSLHGWVNEGLMMIFFLVVGLEVKEQLLVGQLSSARYALLPVAAAAGGMLIPALIYALFNDGATAAGWGIPMSTDIAFALGILALLGRRVPLSLKVFLAALAIADDIGAILVITLFYTGSVVFEGLLLATLFWLAIFVLGRLGIYNAVLYFVLSLGVWSGFYIAGIHPTIAGVLVAVAIPAHSLIDPHRFIQGLRARWQELESQYIHEHLSGRSVLSDKSQHQTVVTMNAMVHDIEPPLANLQHNLQPWVTFIVMPLFALSNAGVTISGEIDKLFTSPVSLGIIFGLLLGKQIGITAFAWLTVRLGLARLPHDLTWRHIHGVGLLAGIGFTVALFITELAFVSDHHLVDEAKLGILFASFAAGLSGLLLLRSVTHSLPAVAAEPDAEPAAEH